ncbi:hypothetical protein [Actinoplanes sp. NPDC051859]|uniref:hypothetical protein n=1 Tax=Actinoplanes sp. NPDC051859 TaxID=3363909 RepID=UPI0037A4D7EC
MTQRRKSRHRAPYQALWPWFVVAVALLTLGATVPLLLRTSGTPQAAVPLPVVSIPQPATATAKPTTSRRPVPAVAQVRKASPVPPVLLGPADAAAVPQLVTDYCRNTVDELTLAVYAGTGWGCGRAPIDLDATCAWKYGDDAYAETEDATDPTGWRCYRDGP